MYQLETNPIEKDIKRFFKEADNNHVRFKIVLHTETIDIPIYRMLNKDIKRDYIRNLGDTMFCELLIYLDNYVLDIFPNRSNLEITIDEETLDDGTLGLNMKVPRTSNRYKAILRLDSNIDPRSQQYHTLKRNDLKMLQPIGVQFELVNRTVDILRFMELGGVFSNTTPSKLLNAVFATKVQQLTIDGKPAIDQLDIVKPDNEMIMNQLVIPDGTKLLNLPTILQERQGGIYNSGLGTYIQTYLGKKTLFIYPLYNALRGDKEPVALHIYAMPKSRMEAVERTTINKNGVLSLLCTTEQKDEQHSTTNTKGFSIMDSDTIMDKPVEITPSGPIGRRSMLNYEVVSEERKDGLNFTPRSKLGSSANPFSEASKITESMGSRVNVIWNYSMPDWIYPGMICKYTYSNNDKTMTVPGVVLFSQSFTALKGPGIAVDTHITTTALGLFIKRVLD